MVRVKIGEIRGIDKIEDKHLKATYVIIKRRIENLKFNEKDKKYYYTSNNKLKFEVKHVKFITKFLRIDISVVENSNNVVLKSDVKCFSNIILADPKTIIDDYFNLFNRTFMENDEKIQSLLKVEDKISKLCSVLGQPNTYKNEELFNWRKTEIKKTFNSIKDLKISFIDINKNIEELSQEQILKSLKELKKKLRAVLKNNSKLSIYKKILKIFSYIFNYDELCNGVSFESEYWDRHELLSRLGVEVCPYCNRQYITSYEFNDKKKTTADLDHFFCKSLYPYLALSLRNFIPSCHICNSLFKSAKDFYLIPHLYPYSEEMEDVFSFHTEFITKKESDKIDTSKYGDNSKYFDINCLLGSSSNFKIKIKHNGNERITNSISTFRLEDVYNSHKEYVRDLIERANYYEKSYIEEIVSGLNPLFKTEIEFRNCIFSELNYMKDYSKRPLSKLAIDILKELKVIK